MCRQPNTPMDYKHRELMNELNNFMIAVKLWIHAGGPFESQMEEVKKSYPKPTTEQIDDLHRRINGVLQQDATPFIKY